ncbi:sulfatase [Coraliomargarita sp. SDUM461003]|uniref:Sulfatase n=1 Tax=Thalassobacterium maritimum TaxID=3041265 RepID=A0ABU1B0D4_9BACT|nr:sulfatase [Coraliomargarita sp. SDUM461003]MDQ8208672.1 sulfatase [Coraliomargarita sp. SDUM461003]
MSKRPNVILINCDDLGYGDLGCYGSQRNQSPNIDRLAKHGLKLNSFYMMSPVCSASRAAMLTGCYPQRIGFGPHSVLFPGASKGIHETEVTLGHVAQAAGYQTKIIGKWHCGDQPEFLPTNRGFDEYFGIPYSNDMGRQLNNEGVMREIPRPPLPLLRDNQVIQQQPDQRGITERYTDEAVRFIEDHQAEPFFLYLAHMYVHVPLFVPQQFLKQSKNGAYGGAVAAIDWSTGVIVDRLKKLGLFENTLIIFTSDNGSRARDEGGSNAPCNGTKASTWEGGQRVPCILHWPDGIQPGNVSDELVRSADFLPSIASLIHSPCRPDKAIDGIDLSGFITGQTTTTGIDTFYYYSFASLCAVRKGDWKLHLSRRDEPNLCELYNLRVDVGETKNVADANPHIVEELQRLAEGVRLRFGDSIQEVEGSEVRPCGHSDNAVALTEYDPTHPYMIACYDLADADMKTMEG